MKSFLLLSFAIGVCSLPITKRQAGTENGWMIICCPATDTNDDGGISFREFMKFSNTVGFLERSELSDLFLHGDGDSNSQLSDGECAPVQTKFEALLKNKVDDYFNKYDLDSNQLLTKEEAKEFATKEHSLDGEKANLAFIQSDNNGDYRLTKHEALKYISEIAQRKAN